MHVNHFTGATLYGHLHVEGRRSEARTALCASLRSRNACQLSQEPLYIEIYRQKGRRPEARTTLCGSLGCRNALRHFTRATLYGNSQAAQIEPRTRTHTLCKPAQSKRMSRFHKSHFIRKFSGKRRETRVSTLIKHRPSLPP